MGALTSGGLTTGQLSAYSLTARAKAEKKRQQRAESEKRAAAIARGRKAKSAADAKWRETFKRRVALAEKENVKEATALDDAVKPEQEPKPEGAALAGRVVGAFDAESLSHLEILATWADSETDCDLQNAIAKLSELNAVLTDSEQSELSGQLGTFLANIVDQLNAWNFASAFVQFKKRRGEK